MQNCSMQTKTLATMEMGELYSKSYIFPLKTCNVIIYDYITYICTSLENRLCTLKVFLNISNRIVKMSKKLSLETVTYSPGVLDF
jgi:hypothetical protein